jgi:hypothetical protein
VNFAALKREINIVERNHAGENLSDVLHSQKRRIFR